MVYSPRGRMESDMTEPTEHAHIHFAKIKGRLPKRTLGG